MGNGIQPSVRNFLPITQIWHMWMYILIALLPVVLSLGLTHSAHAADITVDGTICTLAEAITSANNDHAAGNGCTDGNGRDTLSITRDIILFAALPAINSNMTIQGNVPTRFISGNYERRVFLVERGIVTFQYLTIKNGEDAGGIGGDGYSGGGGGLGAGGGLYVESGTVTIQNVTFTRNNAKGGQGGGYAFGRGVGGTGGGSTNNPHAGGGGSGYTDGGKGEFGGGGGGGGYEDLGNGDFSWGAGGDGGFGGGGGGSAIAVSKGGFGGSDGGYSDGYPDAGGGSGAGLGGALFVRSGSLTLINNTFTYNSATGGSGYHKGSGIGGAIFICTAAVDPSCHSTVVNQNTIYSNNIFLRNSANTYSDVFPFFVNIDVQGNGIVIPSGDSSPSRDDHTDFGSVVVGTAVTRTFTILNSGNVDLTLSGSPRVDLSDNKVGAFSVLTHPDVIVNANGSTSFTIRFDPTFANTVTATVSIASNHSDENPYSFVIQGSGMPVPTAVPTSSPTETRTPTVTPTVTSTPTTTPTIASTNTPTSTVTAEPTPIATPSPVLIVIVTSNQSVSFTQKLQDGSLTVTLPTGAVSKTIELHYSTLITLPTPPAGLSLAGYSFVLDAYLGKLKQEKFIFEQPVLVTIGYQDASLMGFEEAQLVLYYYDAESREWSERGITILERDLEHNRLAVSIDHLSSFALFAGEKLMLNRHYYLPLVIK